MDNLPAQIDRISRSPVLLIATDYDGTLAPLVNDPALAEAHREAVVAIKALAALTQTHMAIISGRSLADLAKHLPEVDRAHLIGSHGSEFEAGFATPLSSGQLESLHTCLETAQSICSQTPGTMVEKKPAGLAFHYRNADQQQGASAVERLLDSTTNQPGIFVRRGKMVVELSVLQTDKGKALQSLRQRFGATAVLFIGDDVTDEDAFGALAGPDLGVKVGEGESSAKYRVPTTLDVAHLLAEIAEKRAAWLAGSDAVPIEKHSILSDQRTVALVDPRGRVCWFCAPRIDSPALFAELLGGPTAGYFEIRPADPSAKAVQKYLGKSFVLQTDWGDVRVIDYLDASGGRCFQRAGRTDLIRVIDGHGRVKLTFAPRLNFGGLETRLRASKEGLSIDGSVEPCVLVSPGIHWKITCEANHDNAVAEITVAGTPISLELRYGTASLAPLVLSSQQRRDQTSRFWEVWASTLKLPKIRPDLVLRSALVLRALCYGPTGAIAAAATTSLPEYAGGVRNWDYRFCWPRDAAMSAAALVRLGAPGPAMKLLDWFLDILENSEPGSLIRPVYTVTGGHLGPEGTIAELSGYRGSRPVRVGNLAGLQVQLDVLGPIAELLSLLSQQHAALTPEHWRMAQSMVSAVEHRWREFDHGIWEIRGNRKHHVHSKVMCWQTVNCCLHIAEFLGYRRPDWEDLRKTIADDVLTRGWHEKSQAFCASYESSEIDAAALYVGLTGLLPANDPRFAATIEAVERKLRRGKTVYRYLYDDGLPGQEGGFNICTTWLIEAYALLGRWDDARQLFDEYCSLAGPTGLLAEEYEPHGDYALGNFPQAYSHIGLISAALRLSSHDMNVGADFQPTP